MTAPNQAYERPLYESKVEHTLTLAKSGVRLADRLADLERARAFGVPGDAEILWTGDDMLFRWWTNVSAVYAAKSS